jgi:hypothetical protein
VRAATIAPPLRDSPVRYFGLAGLPIAPALEKRITTSHQGDVRLPTETVTAACFVDLI